MTHIKYKNFFIILSAIILILAIGVAIPKITVYDTVQVSAQLKQCVDSAMAIHHDNPFERIALALGKSRIVATHGPAEAEVESYTIFRLPLGILWGRLDMKTEISCTLIEPIDWSATTN